MPIRIGGMARSLMFNYLIPSYLKQGLSGNAMIQDARRLGISYRVQTMKQDIARATGLTYGQKVQELLKSVTIIPHSAMPVDPYSRQSQYRVLFNINLKNRITGETDTMSASYYTDQQLSKEEYMDMSLGMLDPETVPSGWSPVSTDFVVVSRSR